MIKSQIFVFFQIIKLYLLFIISSLFSMFKWCYRLRLPIYYGLNLLSFLAMKSSSICRHVLVCLCLTPSPTLKAGRPKGTEIYNPRQCGQCEDKLMHGLNPCWAFFKFIHCISVFKFMSFLFLSPPPPHPRGRKGRGSAIQHTAA